MSITSFYFLCFFTGMLILYYLIPGKCQWMLLLFCSLIYYLTSGNVWLIVYPLLSAAVCYVSIRVLMKTEQPLTRKLALGGAIIVNIGILFTLKYINFGINTCSILAGIFGNGGGMLDNISFLVPLGVSFYSFSLIGYVFDVYNHIAKLQKNFLKLVLYGLYFPVIISGPILRYREDGEQFFEPHAFNYRQVTFGLQRMVWGFFKKLVISERMALIVSTVYGQYDTYGGIYIWLGTVCFAFQLYADFSGCMDIVLGISQTFGLKLPENFENPFFAKSISEYWRKWHITLGVWMKEYVFYPLLRSRFFTNLAKSWKKKLGKKRGKQFTTFLAMLILWFTVGLWHGGDWKYIIGSGLLHWFYIVTGELLEPLWSKMKQLCHLKEESRVLSVIRILRTFFLVNIGFVFFRAESVAAAWQMLISGMHLSNFTHMFTGEIFTLGLDWVEFIIAVVSLFILLAVSILQQKGSLREQIAAKALPIRWIIWYALLFYTILLGYYGPGYSAAEFIYQGF